jgi:hypothetical protein
MRPQRQTGLTEALSPHPMNVAEQLVESFG